MTQYHETEIDLFGRIAIALEQLESSREFAALIPEVRTNMVYAKPDASGLNDVLAIDGRITIVNGMPRAAGRIRFGASGHVARLILALMKIDPAVRAAIDFANPPGFTDWVSGYCSRKGWILACVDRSDEPEPVRQAEGSSMPWKAAEAVRVSGGRVPKIICDAGGFGKEPVCVITGSEPISVAGDLCELARAYVYRTGQVIPPRPPF